MAFLRTIPRVSSRKNIVKCFGLTELSSKLNNVGIKTSSQLLQITERKYSKDASSSSLQSGVCGIKPASRQIDSLDLKFDDPIASFKSKKTMELIRAYLVYQICTIDFVVENNMKVFIGWPQMAVYLRSTLFWDYNVLNQLPVGKLGGLGGPKFMKAAETILGARLFAWLMKGTFYGHFVAGEDEVKIMPTLKRLQEFGVKPILDYSVEEDLSQEEAERREVKASVSEAGDETKEGTLKKYHVDKSFADRRYKVSSARTYFYLNEASCERNMDIFIKCLESVSAASQGMGIIAIKMTALGRPQLLLQLSEVIMRARQYMSDVVGGEGAVLAHHAKPDDFRKRFEAAQIKDAVPVRKFLDKIQSDKEGVIHLFPWSGILDENYELSETFQVPDIKTGKMVKLMTQLTPKEEEMFRNMIRRLTNIVNVAEKLNVRIMIDAEQTYFQPAISRLTLEMMRKYNTEKAVVFNTYQTYLKDSYYEVKTDLEQAERQNFYFGAKIVRGAYIEQERARAAAMGYADPTNPTYEATTESYHRTLMECLGRMKQFKDKGEDIKKIGIMVASHNEDTVRFAIEKMKEIGISPEDKVICFGQLFGMCDYLTFPLGQSGYSAFKYIPYGPVKEVLPYLSRRAQENRGVLTKIKKEKRLLFSEIKRRILTGKWFYKPKGNYTPV